ncbi:MAG: hypothetical protein ACLFWB_10160 [Armatimonadota bacterium]
MRWGNLNYSGLAVAAFLTVALLGCAGGGKERATETGTVKFSVTFPPLEESAQTATIYGATNSITVDLVDPEANEPVVTQTVINRPEPQSGEVTVLISDIPEGQWLLKTVGWEQEDGGGQALSRAEENVTVSGGATTDKSVIMDGWPYSLDLMQTPYWLLVDGTAQLTVTPRDVDSNTLLGNFSYTLSSSNPGCCTVSTSSKMADVGPAQEEADAVLTGVANGDATVTAKLLGGPDAAPAVTGSMPVHVYDNIDEVVIDPASVTLKLGETATLTAIPKYKGEVCDDIAPFVMWNFLTTGECTSIDFTGGQTAEVTAVAREGTDVITATQTLNSASADCLVTVQ